MNKLAKYIIIIAGCAAVLFVAWYFGSVLADILIAAILSLIGKPVMKLLTSIRVGKLRIGNSLYIHNTACGKDSCGDGRGGSRGFEGEVGHSIDEIQSASA